MTPEKYQIDLEEVLYHLGLSEQTIQRFKCIQTNTRERAIRILWESRLQMGLIDDFCKTESYYLLSPFEQKMLAIKYMEIEINLYENSKQ